MRKNIFFWILTLGAIFILQMGATLFFSFKGVFPNFLLSAVVFLGVYFGAGTGEWIGFFLGLLGDSASLSLFGSQSFMLTLIGFLAGRLKRKIDEEKNIVMMGLVLIFSFFYVFGLLFFEVLFGGSSSRFVSTVSLFQPFYSAGISPVFFWILRRWCSFYKKKEEADYFGI